MAVHADPLPHYTVCVCVGGGVLYGFNGLIGLVGLEEGVTSGNWSPTAVEEQS